MKLSNATRITRDDLPDLPAAESFDLLLDHINTSSEQLTQALQQNVTIADNMNAAIVTQRMTHGTEVTIKNPLKVRPVGIKAIRTIAINGGTQYALAGDPVWRFIDGPDPTAPQQIGITARFEPPHGEISVERTTDQLIATATPTTVQFSSASLQAGDLSWSSGANTKIVCARAGLLDVRLRYTFDTAAGGYREISVTANGSVTFYAHSLIPGGSYAAASGAELISVSAGDYLEALAYQTSGGNLNLLANRVRLTARYVAPPLTAQNDVAFVVYGG